MKSILSGGVATVWLARCWQQPGDTSCHRDTETRRHRILPSSSTIVLGDYAFATALGYTGEQNGL